MIPENLLSSFYCVLNETKHIVERPITLACGHNACRDCIGNMGLVKCIKCNQVDFIEINKLNENECIKSTISYFVNDLFQVIEGKFETVLSQLNGKFF
jgi:hypothetical protein